MVNGLQTFQRHFAFLRAYAADLPDPTTLGLPMTAENLLRTLRTLLSPAPVA